MGIHNIGALTDPENHDETDVPEALKRKTEDGPGFTTEEELPPSDIEGEDDK